MKKIKMFLLLVLFTFSSFNLVAQSTSLISDCSDFTSGPSAWPFVLIATTIADGAASQAAQTYTMNVTSLPAGGANFRVYKTTANGNDFFGNAIALTLGVNTITVAAVTFDRAVKFQFSSGDVEFDALSLNGVDSECVCSTSYITDTVEACDSYTWIDGNTYTSSNNTATYTLTNTSSCDTVVTLDLTITNVNATVVAIDDSTLQAQSSTGVIYQWVDCNDNFSPIAGANNVTFTTQNSGEYAVEVTFNNCSVISNCLTLPSSISSLDALEKDYEYQIFPNPTTNDFTISLEGVDNVEIIILDIHGKVMLHQSGILDQGRINISDFVAGTYFVKIINSEDSRVIRVNKN